MDFDLTDEQRLIRDTAREFTDKEIVERTRENARNHHFDLELVKKVAAQGYLGAIVPHEYGGAGLDYFSYGLVVEEIGRGDSAMRTVVSVQTSLVCSSILLMQSGIVMRYFSRSFLVILPVRDTGWKLTAWTVEMCLWPKSMIEPSSWSLMPFMTVGTSTAPIPAFLHASSA